MGRGERERGGGEVHTGEKHEAAWTKDGEESLNEGRSVKRMGRARARVEF